MTDLTQRHCRPREGDDERLGDGEAATLLAQVPGWKRDGNAIEREFGFKNYYETLAFVNALAWVAHREDHHPDIQVGYKTCRVRYTTHSVGGLSENDFICAAKLNLLMAL